MQICGIDYGSKLAGTTAFALLDTDTNKISIAISEKKKDADAFVTHLVLEKQPDLIFIDAPLSLPKVYANLKDPQEENPDFFYRAGDKMLGAMSPLFLGGLTARAMRLVHTLGQFKFYETYPAWQARRLELKALHYKKELTHLPQVKDKILQYYPEWQIPTLNSWHELDAVLALVGAWRFVNNEQEVFGNEEEGAIYV